MEPVLAFVTTNPVLQPTPVSPTYSVGQYFGKHICITLWIFIFPRSIKWHYMGQIRHTSIKLSDFPTSKLINVIPWSPQIMLDKLSTLLHLINMAAAITLSDIVTLVYVRNYVSQVRFNSWLTDVDSRGQFPGNYTW